MYGICVPEGGSQINMMGMIVEIVEKHPGLKVTNMGMAPTNFTPKSYFRVRSKQTMVNCAINRKICLNIE